MRSLADTGIAPPDALSRRIHAAVRTAPTPTLRPRLRNAIALLIATLLTVSVVAAASQWVYGDQAMGLHAGINSPLLTCIAIALLFLLYVSTSAALGRGRSGLGPSTATLATMVIATAPLYALFALGFPVHEDVTAIGSVSISPLGTRCLLLALLVGVIVLGCFAWSMRGAAPVGARIRSMALGSAAGIWAGLAVFVFCPSGDSVHVSIGHLLPVVSLTFVGAVTLPRIVKP